jgi:outer membrane protein assembly factor BamB
MSAPDLRPPPQYFAGYWLEQLLLVDSVSSVYRAISETRSRPVSLRISQPLLTHDDPDGNAIASYMEALSAVAAVHHPALATIYDAGEVGGRVYVATDLVAGMTLDEYVGRHGPLPADEAVALLWPIADGLDLAHAARVIHRAISPRTIRVGQHHTSTPVILNGFGLDALLANQARVDRSRIDVVDVCYVAPERLGGGRIDGRADQYALACALYHCVAGRPPFIRDAAGAMFGAHLFNQVQVPPGRAGRYELGAAVATGMAKRPEDRYPSCTALLTAGAGGSTTPVHVSQPNARRASGGTRRPTMPQRPLPRRRRLPISWPVAAMLVLAGIVCTLLFAAVLRADDGSDAESTVGVKDYVPAASLATTGGASPEWVGLHWQRALIDEPIRHLRMTDNAVVAAAYHRVIALSPEGVMRWSHDVDAGALADAVIAGPTLGVRSARFSALDLADGSLRWHNNDVLTPLTALTATHDTIYGIRRGPIAAELVALDAATGQRRWSFDGGRAAIDSDAAVVASDDSVWGPMVAVLQDGDLFVVDADRSPAADGRLDARWRVAIDRPWMHSLTALPGAVLVATRDGQVCAYAWVDGAQRWCMPIVGLDDHEPVILAGEDAVVMVMPFHVTALAAHSGTQRWVHAAPGELGPIAAIGSDVVVVDVAGTTHGLDIERGHERWRASGFGQITALTAAADAIYAGADDGRVACLRLEAPHQMSWGQS